VNPASMAADALLPLQALAQSGAGPSIGRWHASDVIGLAALALVIGLAVWANRRR
jgi:hypothetical protein